CAKNKWLINNEFYFNGTGECKNSLKHLNEGDWFVTKDGVDVEITEAECTEFLDCFISTRYSETCPCAAKDCCGQLIANDGIRCPVEHTLRVIQKSGVKLTMEKLSCDSEKGHWIKDGNKSVVIDRGANVYCE
ncbi:hypothetical protein PFISCL1PPCAC_26049, partial [Pristionchus fissidentatus]